MRLYLRWFVDKFDLSTNWLVYLLAASYALGLLIGWINPGLIIKHAWEFATLTFLLAIACYASYTVKVNKLLRKIENVERTVTHTADKFFVAFNTLQNDLTEKIELADEVVVCATFPFYLLKDWKSQWEKLLSRKNRFVLIVPDPKGSAHQMAIARATPYENETRKKLFKEYKELLKNLEKYAITNGGQFSLKGTDYWPSCIMTHVRSWQNYNREDLSIFLTINNYGQPDKLRSSFVVTQEKEPITYNIFREDLRNIEENSKTLTIEEVTI